MRLDPPAPGDQVQPSNVHWAQIVSDEPIEVHVGTTLPITQFLRAVRDSEILRTLPRDLAPLCGSILLLMLDLVSGKEYRASKRLVCWPSRALLGWHVNRQFGHVARALSALKEAGVIRPIEPGGGIKTTRWELLPPEASPGAHARRVPARQRAGSQRAGAPGPSAPARPEPARLRAPTRRAGAPQKLIDRNRSIETGSIPNTTGSSSSTPPVQEPAPEGRSAAAAAELEGLEVHGQKLGECLALPTTTRAIVRAADKVRRARKGDTGLLLWFILHPDEIPPKYIRAAERELMPRTLRAGAQGGAAPGQSVADREQAARELAKIGKEALARARAEG